MSALKMVVVLRRRGTCPSVVWGECVRWSALLRRGAATALTEDQVGVASALGVTDSNYTGFGLASVLFLLSLPRRIHTVSNMTPTHIPPTHNQEERNTRRDTTGTVATYDGQRQALDPAKPTTGVSLATDIESRPVTAVRI